MKPRLRCDALWAERTRVIKGRRRASEVNVYNNVLLPAGDLGTAEAFYSQALGLALKFSLAREGVVACRVGDEEPANFLGTRWTKPAIWFEVEDVCAAYEIGRASCRERA